MDISIIPCQESDRSFFRKVHHESYRASIEAMFGWDEALQDRFADADFDARNIHFIVYQNQTCGVVGWIDTEHDTELGPLYLLDRYQGLGIGSQIVKQFISKANEGSGRLRLKTLRSNTRAKSLYERLGFIVTDNDDKHWHMHYSKIQ